MAEEKTDQVEAYTRLAKHIRYAVFQCYSKDHQHLLSYGLSAISIPILQLRKQADRLSELMKATQLSWNKNSGVMPKPTLLTPQCYTFHF